MTPGRLFEGEPAGTREAIMRATYRALREHGYAGLTIQRIGDEFPKSKSLLYHHYDGKDELLVEFLEYMLEHYEETVPRLDHDDAHAHLLAVLDRVLPDDRGAERSAFAAAMVELRAQAAHDDAYRDHFTRSDAYFRERIAEIVARGIDEGVYRPVDPDRVAALILTAITGALTRRATADVDEEVPAVREELRRYVESLLLPEDGG